MKHKTRIAAGLAGLALLALLGWAFAPRPLEVETGSAARRSFSTFIEEDGKTRLRERYIVSAPLAGRLQRSSLHEGDAVAAGATLAVLSPVLSPLLDERSLRSQQAQLDMAQAQLQAAAARVEGARVGLLRARNDQQRSEQLARQGFVAPTRLESERLAVQAAQQELDAAQQEHHVAGHQVEQARAALLAVRDPARLAGGGFALSAPVGGRVLRVLQASETVVALGTPLIELGDTSQLEVVAELLSTDALQARPGSPVLIERWGGPGTLKGHVRLVEPGAFTKISALGVEEQRVKVLIDLDSPQAEWQALGDGYRVGVRILTRLPAERLTVPVGAVFPLPEGGMGVFQLDGGRARQRPVTLGARNGELAWISAGLDEGAEVVIYPPAQLRDGQRLRRRGAS